MCIIVLHKLYADMYTLFARVTHKVTDCKMGEMHKYRMHILETELSLSARESERDKKVKKETTLFEWCAGQCVAQ